MGVEVAVLTVTGIALLFNYRPEPITSVSGFGRPGPSPQVLSTRGLHIWTSRLLILTVVIAAVTVGTDVRGYGFVLPGSRTRVLFVLIDNVETSVATIRWELVAHMAIALVIATLMLVAGLRIRQRRTPQIPPPPYTQELDAVV